MPCSAAIEMPLETSFQTEGVVLCRMSVLLFASSCKSPGFALTVILTMALGIGANTAIFTLVHAVLLKSLPVVDPKTLYRVGDKDDCCVNGGFINEDGDMDMFSYELYRRFRDNTPEFSNWRRCSRAARA